MKRLLVVLGLLCPTFDTALAQTSGEITGEVKDPSGAVMPNARVTVTNTATNAGRSTVTNSSGVYSPGQPLASKKFGGMGNPVRG